MPEVLQKPERARRPDTRGFVVHDDRTGRIDAPRRENVRDHPEKRLQWRGVGVVQAESPEIQVESARDASVREVLGGTRVDDLRQVEGPGQLGGLNEKVRHSVDSAACHS